MDEHKRMVLIILFTELLHLGAYGTQDCPDPCICTLTEATKGQQYRMAVCFKLPEHIPGDIARLQVVSEMPTVSGNQFLNFQSLQMLDLSSCNISILGPDAFWSTPNIVTLYLSRNRIMELESELFPYNSKLKELYLDNNGLKIIDGDAFAKLNSLEKLFLQNNHLLEITYRLPITLIQLDLSNNKIGPSITAHHYLPSLKYLNLCGNEFDFFSATSMAVPHLQSLCVGDNQVEMNVGITSQMPHIANLTLSAANIHNAILSPDAKQAITSLQSLSSLGISHYQINDFGFLSDLTQILHLHLQHINFTGQIRSHNFDLQMLHSLYLDGSANLAQQVLQSSELANCVQLRFLSLRDTGLTHLDVRSIPENEVLQLDISSNPLHCDCGLRWMLDRSNYHRGHLLHAPEKIVCATPPSRKGLPLTEAQLCEGERSNIEQSPDVPTTMTKQLSPNGKTAYIVLGCLIAVLVAVGIGIFVVYHKRLHRTHPAVDNTVNEPTLTQLEESSYEEISLKS